MPTDILPNITEWMGERVYFNEPWWNRSDSSMIDMTADDTDDLSIKPELGINLIELVTDNSDLIESIDVEKTEDETKKSAEILRPTFRPRIIISDDNT